MQSDLTHLLLCVQACGPHVRALVPCWQGVGTYFLSFSFWRKNAHRRGEGTCNRGHEYQAEARGEEHLEWELGHPHTYVRAAAQWEGRDELPQPNCPLSQVLPGPSGLGWAGKVTHTISGEAEAEQPQVLEYCGNKPERMEGRWGQRWQTEGQEEEVGRLGWESVAEERHSF